MSIEEVVSIFWKICYIENKVFNLIYMQLIIFIIVYLRLLNIYILYFLYGFRFLFGKYLKKMQVDVDLCW